MLHSWMKINKANVSNEQSNDVSFLPFSPTSTATTDDADCAHNEYDNATDCDGDGGRYSQRQELADDAVFCNDKNYK